MPRPRSSLVLLALAALLLVGCQPEPEAPRSTPTTGTMHTSTPAATPTPTATATATLAPDPTQQPVAITCDTISTPEHQQDVVARGFIWWESADAVENGPFSSFPNGPPDGQVECNWGISPDLATDDVMALAWAPIDPENAVAAMQLLTEQGYIRTDGPGGVYLSLRYEGRTDAEGWGLTYYFTDDDVRWAATRSLIERITSPDGTG